MKKKQQLFIIIALVLGFLSGYLVKSSQQIPEDVSVDLLSQKQSSVYVCPMHNHITSSTKDTCPICGMDLELKETHTLADETNHNLIKLPNAVINNLSIKKGMVIRGSLQRNVETLGKITRLDSTARNIVTTPIEGKISYIADKFQGDDVTKDELLFSVTSQKLNTLIEEYSLAIEEKNQALSSDLSIKLMRMGLTREQLTKIQNKQEKFQSVNVLAQENGFIFIRRGELNSLVKPGYTVFNIGGDYQMAEVTAEIYEREWSRLQEGQKATMTLRNIPGKVFDGFVSRVEPPVGYTTRSLEIKLKFKINDKRVSQSMFANINITGQAKENVLLVPTVAVIQDQNQQRVVRINARGEFQPVKIIAGEESLGMTEVINGLQEGDAVVTSGQFLIDSESQISAGLNRIDATQ